jgi:hypothetical protein
VAWQATTALILLLAPAMESAICADAISS